MKKVLLTMLIVLGMTSCAWAGELSLTDTLEKLPALKQGIAYSLEDSKINYLSTIEVLKWKGIDLEVGYAGAAKNTGSKFVGVVSYPIANLKDLGVDVPILDLVELNAGIYCGYGRIQLNDGQETGNNEWDFGLSLTLLNIKF